MGWGGSVLVLAPLWGDRITTGSWQQRNDVCQGDNARPSDLALERSQRLRQQNRRILRWSLAAAAVLHIAVLFLVTWDRPTHVFARETEIVEIGEAAMARLQSRMESAGARLDALQASLDKIADTPERLMQTAITTSADRAAETLYGLRGCTRPEI